MEQRIKITQDADILVRQLLNIGEAMYQAGAEISRIEDSLHRLGKAYGAIHVSVYAITSSIVITAEFATDYSVTQNRRITRRGGIDCLKMEKLNQLCRECAANPIDVNLLRDRVLAILGEQPVPWQLYLGQLVAASFFAVFFGGSWLDAGVAAVGAAVICLMQRWIRQFFTSQLFFHVAVAFVTGVVVNLIHLALPDIHVNEILIGDIMVLIPGIAITNSIRFILSGDMVSSFEKLMDSLLQAFGIATGFALSIYLMNGAIVDATVLSGSVPAWLQLMAAAVGTFGFSMLFNVRKRHLAMTTAGGFLCWLVYLLVMKLTDSVFTASLAAAFVVGVYGEIMARAVKVPTTIIFIPASIPLIPGGNLYYAVLSIISGEWDQFSHHLLLLALYAVSISLGLAIVVEGEKMMLKIVRILRQRRNR